MRLLKNVVTFGASGRIEKKVDEFEDLKAEYQDLYNQMEHKRENVNKVLEKVIKTKVNSVKSLSKVSKLSKNLKGKERDFLYRTVGNEFQSVNFEQIEKTISVGQMAINATKGAVSGVSTAVGAWALVSTFGTASTGTAIATLTGAAGTNATLAWFGGGALAASGGGMAAGTAVLGGLIAIPALALTGVFNHVQASKKIKKIEEQMMEIIKTIDQMQANILKMELIDKRSDELITSLEKSKVVFNKEFKKVYKEIYKIPMLSKCIKWARKNIFRQNYFSEKDLKRIAYIGGLAGDFAILIDTKVFDEI